MSAPAMSSRLDRLLMLLSSGSSPTTRALASQQLASVVRAQPDDAHHILARLHPLLRHEQWEVRTAAVNAVAAVLAVMRDFHLKEEADDDKDHTPAVKQEPTTEKRTLLRFESFDLQEALDRASEAFDEALAGEDSPSGSSQADDKCPEVAVDRQRREMAKTLGLDITGGSTEELFTNDDLKQQEPDASSLSARERNRLKRVLAKKTSLDEVKRKRKKEECLYKAPDARLDPNAWALDAFCNCLLCDLQHRSWEVRHGAASALRELVRLHGVGGGVGPSMGKEDAVAAHRAWMSDVALRVVSVMASDRFGDFISDQVLAPVRESSAQALGALLKIMPEEDVTKTTQILLQCLKQEDWQCRHGALLGIKYMLVAREDLEKAQLSEVIPAVVSALEDQEDDVVSVAASAIVPLLRRADFFAFFDTTSFEPHLWEYIKCVDELASSTPSILLLLSEFIQLRKCQPASSKAPGPSPVEKVAWLSKFLAHSSSKVRKTSLLTLETIVDADFLGELGAPSLSRLCSELFQRSLLEHKEDCLQLVERVWNAVCDESPLNQLLFGTCLAYGNWLSMLVLPPAWPLPPALILTSRAVSENQFLGGAEAQHQTNAVEKERRTTQARLLGIRLLGKLAAFIVRPGQGIDYSSQNLPPVDMFVQKILLPNLNTRSAYQRTTTCLVISEWCRQHPESKATVPEYLKTALSGFLSEQIHYDEVLHAHVSIQNDFRDFIATLKHYKVPVVDIADKTTILGEISDFLAQLELGSLLTASKIKPGLANTLVERRNGIVSALQQASKDQSALAVMTLASVAGALVSLDFLPEKLNPIIRPLMDSVKTEQSELLQSLAAEKLARLLEMCTEQRLMAPVEKTLKNLVVFACADLSVTPVLVASPDDEENRKILALKFKEVRALQASGARSKARPKRNATKTGDESCLDHESVEDASPSESVRVQSRGANRALATIVAYFDADLFQRLPVWYNLTIDAMLSYGTEKAAQSSDLVMYLRALEISVPVLSATLDSHLVDILTKLFQMLESAFSSVRHLSSRCASEIAVRKPGAVMLRLVELLLPQMESAAVASRQGAVECVACIVERLDVRVVPYITLLVIPVLGRMSDSDADVRVLATNVFATLVRLAPLEGAAQHDHSDLPKELIERRARESGFLNQLLNVKNLEEYRLPVSVDADLRPYQTEGVKWLSFLNRYKLHGILCDDMGLGKTLQTICILVGDHWKLDSVQSSRQNLPSLVICPATLCNHWYFETLRFVGGANVLSPIVYSGPVTLRADLRRRLSRHNLVITSYEVIRNDIEHFSERLWNYLVLDEGHLIKNAKAKTTLAIKSLKAQHRLILSGTPIQNSVLDLWSLFDFLMPGFLGSEREFGVRYGKPIVASRDPRSSSKEQEAGALALEALHKQVLPFILRRMKEDVLKDLPPKIVQDFHCELSPLQVQLYEDFSQSQLESARAKSSSSLTGEASSASDGGGMKHIFQALQYLRKVCNHPKLVLSESHPQISKARELLASSRTSLSDIGHAAKLPALRDLLLQCGIGGGRSGLSSGLEGDIVVQHRALVYFQFKAMMDIVESDLLKATMPEVTYLRLDGSVAANNRQAIVDRFNKDASIDLLLLSTSIGGLGLNLTGADTVIFVEHDWNPMKDLQAMDRAHRIGQKKVVNVYRLITRNTIEEKIMGLQKFKLHTASSVINCENSSLGTMATDQILDLFSLDAKRQSKEDEGRDEGKGLKAMLENLPELWGDEQYEQEYDLESYMKKV